MCFVFCPSVSMELTATAQHERRVEPEAALGKGLHHIAVLGRDLGLFHDVHCFPATIYYYCAQIGPQDPSVFNRGRLGCCHGRNGIRQELWAACSAESHPRYIVSYSVIVMFLGLIVTPIVKPASFQVVCTSSAPGTRDTKSESGIQSSTSSGR